MAKTTESQKRATMKHLKEAYDEIKFRVRKGEKEKIRNFAESKGECLTGFIKRVVYDAMENNK